MLFCNVSAVLSLKYYTWFYHFNCMPHALRNLATKLTLCRTKVYAFNLTIIITTLFVYHLI